MNLFILIRSDPGRAVMNGHFMRAACVISRDAIRTENKLSSS